MRLTYLLSLSLGFAAVSFSQTAAAQSATLDPGLYEVSSKVVITGRVVEDEVEDKCILAGQNVKTLDGLVLEFTKRKDECQLRNAQGTGSTMRADFTCPPLSTGGKVGGTIEAEYGADWLNYTIDTRFGPISRVTKTNNMRRKGGCDTE